MNEEQVIDMEYAMEMRMKEEPCDVVIVEDDVEVKVKINKSLARKKSC